MEQPTESTEQAELEQLRARMVEVLAAVPENDGDRGRLGYYSHLEGAMSDVLLEAGLTLRKIDAADRSPDAITDDELRKLRDALAALKALLP